MKKLTTGERLHKIGDRLDEFGYALDKSDDLDAQFQVGYFVHHEDVAWLWRQHIELIRYAEEARMWMMGKHVDDLSLSMRNRAIAIRINIERFTR